MQSASGENAWSPGPLFVFDTQPLAQPPAGVLFHRSVGFADRPQTEVVGPTIDLPVERCYHRCRILLGLTPAGHLADRLTQTLHSLLGWSRAQIGPPRLRRVASTKRIPEKIELLFRQSQTRVLVSFTVNFSFDIMSRIAASASSARPDNRSRDHRHS